jgi:hypothetical protein
MRFTDNADARAVLEEVADCALHWVPDARLIGNVRAGDIARACGEALDYMPARDERCAFTLDMFEGAPV